MTQSMTSFPVFALVLLPLIAARADEPPGAKPDPAAVARQLLDDALPADHRGALIREHAPLAPELIGAMTAGLKAGAEEYRRIPWIWRVAIAAGRRDDTTQMRRILDLSLPKPGESLRDWHAVVIGGGLINGLSLEKKWPAQRFAELLKDDETLKKRWQAALADSQRMADNEKVPTGTRYDALRMIALDSWDNSGKRLAGYLKKGTHPELQMGAVSGLSDVDRPEVAALLADALPDLPAENRRLALDALLRIDARKAVLRERLEGGKVDRSWLTEAQRAALREPKP